MNSYKIETKNEATGGWDAVATLRPDYAASTLFQGWFRKHRYIVISNADEAELAAELKAIALAKRLRGSKRIERSVEIDGAKTKFVFWENGRWLEPVGLLKRVRAWSV